jgi:hypothetical protein
MVSISYIDLTIDEMDTSVEYDSLYLEYYNNNNNNNIYSFTPMDTSISEISVEDEYDDDYLDNDNISTDTLIDLDESDMEEDYYDDSISRWSVNAFCNCGCGQPPMFVDE